MNKEQAKEEVLKTLQKVEPNELPAFMQALKVKAFIHLACGLITEEVSNAIFEAIAEFNEVTE